MEKTSDMPVITGFAVDIAFVVAFSLLAGQSTNSSLVTVDYKRMIPGAKKYKIAPILL